MADICLRARELSDDAHAAAPPLAAAGRPAERAYVFRLGNWVAQLVQEAVAGTRSLPLEEFPPFNLNRLSFPC